MCPFDKIFARSCFTSLNTGSKRANYTMKFDESGRCDFFLRGKWIIETFYGACFSDVRNRRNVETEQTNRDHPAFSNANDNF